MPEHQQTAASKEQRGVNLQEAVTHWTKLAGGLPNELFGRSNVAISNAKPNRIYALIEAKPGSGLYRSEDAGNDRVLGQRAKSRRAYEPLGAGGQNDVDFRSRVHELGPGVLERVAGTVTPQPVLAVLPYLDVPLDEVLGASFLVVCVDVRDPGNAGTILRSAEASGADGVICCAGSVDVYNPKTVRASAGALSHAPRGGSPLRRRRAIGT